MTDRITFDPGVIDRFPGATFSPLQRDRTLFFYGQPMVFTARSDDGRSWLVMLVDEADKTADWLVLETSPEQHRALEVSRAEDCNRIGKLAIQSGHGGIVLTVRSRDDAVLEERRVGVAEAMSLGIIEADTDVPSHSSMTGRAL